MRVKEKIEVINAAELDYRALNERIRQCGSARINACLGQRFIASGMREGEIEIHGTPGNALGAYMDGCRVEVCGNAQDVYFGEFDGIQRRKVYITVMGE